MKFGPEVDDALGGRLAGATHQLTSHCAAILRALLLNRGPACVYIGAPSGMIRENQYELHFASVPKEQIDERLQFLSQEGFFDERDLTKFVSSKTVRTHLLHRGTHSCVILTTETNRPTKQRCQLRSIAFLPRLLPEIFAGKKVSELEQALLKAASEADCAAIEDILEKLYKESDLCDMRQKRLLHNVISHSLNMDLRRANEGVQQHEHNAELALRNYMENSQAAVEKRVLAEDIERRIGGMSQVVEEVMDFLRTNKAVNVNVESNRLVLEVTGPLTNFDADSYRTLRKKTQPGFYEYIIGNQEDALLFLDALFLEESIKVLIGARYSIDPRSGVSGIKGTTIPGVIQNPHIHYYGCLGQYATDMQQALFRSDITGLISICIASGKSLNIPEPPTYGRFVRDVTGGRQKAVLLPNGETVSYKQAVAWLKQQKGIEEVEPDGETDQDYSDGD